MLSTLLSILFVEHAHFSPPSVFASPAWPTSMLSFGPPLDVVSLSFSLLALGRGGCSGAWFRPEGGTV